MKEATVRKLNYITQGDVVRIRKNVRTEVEFSVANGELPVNLELQNSFMVPSILVLESSKAQMLSSRRFSNVGIKLINGSFH